MRPTKAGLGLLAGAIICGVVGRAFGSIEMYFLAGMCLCALVLAMLYTSTTKLDLGVSRVASPARLRAGSPARVDLTLTNRTRRSTPVMEVQDRVQEHSGAVLTLAPITKNQNAKVAYRLPTSVRGPIEIGPMSLTLGDPMGLTRSTVVASGQVDLLVHPALINLRKLKAAAGRDPLSEQRLSRSLANSGDEFFALRPYIVGDELRRVHWPATARRDELVVRQTEKPRSGRLTVVLDHQSPNYSDVGFERAVSAALSVLVASFNGEDGLRFANSSNPSGVDINMRSELNAIDQQLAYLQRTDTGSLAETLESVLRFHGGGMLVVICAEPSRACLQAIERAERAFIRTIVIACEPTTDVSANDLPNNVLLYDEGTPNQPGDDPPAAFIAQWEHHLTSLGIAQ